MNTYDKIKEDQKKYGHFKGNFYEDFGNPYTSAACLLGSLHRVLGTVETRYHHLPKAAGLLEDIIAEQYPDRLTINDIIPSFNDHEDTTPDDIERVLEKASVQFDERI